MSNPEILKGIRTRYSKASLNELKKLMSNKQTEERIIVHGISIDNYYSLDRDDGFKYYKTPEGHILEVSIADVDFFVKKGSALDLEAKQRTTSLYLQDRVVHMFPEEIATNLASLTHKEYRPTLTFRTYFDKSFVAYDFEVFKSMFYNDFMMNHEQFNDIVSDTSDELHDEIMYYIKATNHIYSHRNPKINFCDDDRRILVDNSKKHDCSSQDTASFIIQEAMIITNKMLAKWAIENNIIGVFRNHMPEARDIDPIYIKVMERAVYSSKMIFHFGLYEEYYTHVTSPIRRYADLVLHRQIKAFLENRNPEYTTKEIVDITLYINEQVYNLKKLQKEHEEENEQKRRERTLLKIVDGQEIDFERISIHSFEIITEKILDNQIKMKKDFRLEFISRMKSNLIKEKIIYKTFLYTQNSLLAFNIAFHIVQKELENPFMAYVRGIPGFSMDYIGENEAILKYKKNVIIRVICDSKTSQKQIRKDLIKKISLEFYTWYMNNKEEIKLPGQGEFFLIYFIKLLY